MFMPSECIDDVTLYHSSTTWLLDDWITDKLAGTLGKLCKSQQNYIKTQINVNQYHFIAIWPMPTKSKN